MPHGEEIQDDDFLGFVENVAILGVLLFEAANSLKTIGNRRFPGFDRFAKTQKSRAALAANVRHRFFVNRSNVRITSRLAGRIGDFYIRQLERSLKSSGAIQNLRRRVPLRSGELRSSAYVVKQGRGLRMGYADSKARYVRYKRPIRGQTTVEGSLRQYARSAHFRQALARARILTQESILSGRLA